LSQLLTPKLSGIASRLEIQTERLRLIELSLNQLQLHLASPDQLECASGYPISRAIITDRVRRAIHMKIAKMQQAEEKTHPWYTYWLIAIRDPLFGAGLVGFKGYPDDDGEVEIGYGIDPLYQRKGYMTEAVNAMITWAFQQPICQAVIAANTARDNLASNRVLEKAGMTICAESDDELFWRIVRGDIDSKN
jgi:RimJ/RimL family protein N-acetyltransferase